MKIRGQVFRDYLIDVVAVTKITENTEGTQDNGDEENGRVEEKAETMAITLQDDN